MHIEGLAPLLFTEAELDARKLRGAFFTPQPIAAFLAAWAIRHPSDTIFEPSCGEAIFLGEAVSRLQMLGNLSPSAEQIQGTDIDEASVEEISEGAECSLAALRGPASGIQFRGEAFPGDGFQAATQTAPAEPLSDPQTRRYEENGRRQAHAGAARI